jgi:uncharacterized membrane protein YebE (DUF533 family)
MDLATRDALRAIVSALHSEGVVTDDGLAAIAGSVEAAGRRWAAEHMPAEATTLLSLASSLLKDAAGEGGGRR